MRIIAPIDFHCLSILSFQIFMRINVDKTKNLINSYTSFQSYYTLSLESHYSIILESFCLMNSALFRTSVFLTLEHWGNIAFLIFFILEPVTTGHSRWAPNCLVMMKPSLVHTTSVTSYCVLAFKPIWSNALEAIPTSSWKFAHLMSLIVLKLKTKR